MMNIDISILIAIIGCLVGVFGFLRNRDKDTKDNGTIQATLETDIKYIKDTLEEIRLDNREANRKIGEHNSRIIVLEENNKIINSRLDKLEEKIK